MTDTNTVAAANPMTANGTNGVTAMVEVAAAAMQGALMVPVEMMKFGFGMQMKVFSMMESMLPGANRKHDSTGTSASPSSQSPHSSTPSSPTMPAVGWGPVTRQHPVSGWGPMPPREVA